MWNTNYDEWNFMKVIYTNFYMSYLVIQDWVEDQRSVKEEDNSKFIFWVVSSSCSWNCIIGQWDFLAYIVPQLLIGLESINRDSLYWIFSLTPNRVHPLTRNLYINILSSGSHPHQGFPLAMVSLVNKIWFYEFSYFMVIFIIQHS